MARLARETDPVESHEAADDLESSGQEQADAEIAYGLVVQHPGLTARELDQLYGSPEGKIRKRLKGLESAGRIKRGPVRRSTATGKPGVTWLPAKADDEDLSGWPRVS